MSILSSGVILLRDWSHWNRAYIIEESTGTQLDHRRFESDRVAGFAKKCTSGIVAVYKASVSGTGLLILQSGRTRLPMDNDCILSTESSWWGLRRSLQARNDKGDVELTATDSVIGPPTFGKLHPFYRAWDEYRGDYLSWIYNKLSDANAKQHFLETWDVKAGRIS
jgi:hypothetical protein